MLKGKPYFKRATIYFCYLLFTAKSVYAQTNQSIIGTVISAEGGKPIPGVTIALENKGIGSITNAEGKFIIAFHNVYDQTDSLTFSCVGYKSKKAGINSALKNGNFVIRLSEFITNLSEVTVKPLTLKQLLDSITHHNEHLFVSPAILKGYYREFVYTNTKCTEYADALWEYYLNLPLQPDGQLKINASRCLKEIKDNEDRHNVELYNESKINPNVAFRYALLTAMIEKYFPEKNLSKYKYDIEQSDDPSGDNKIIISPKAESMTEFYQLTLLLKNDYTLKSWRLEIPENLLIRVKERSALGIHVKTTKFTVEVNYSMISGHIYPNYYSTIRTNQIWGKFLGATINQSVDNKSDFIVSEVDNTKHITPFEKQTVYHKGNVCNNGIAINDTLLRNYTIIKPTQKDSISIKSMINK